MTRVNVLCLLALCGSMLFLTACNTPKILQDNEGSTLTTSKGASQDASNLYGKWDIDGELTNTARGDAGITDIPSDVVTDVLGKGWTFRSNNTFESDTVTGASLGKWSLSGDQLTIQHPNGKTGVYSIYFKNGYMYVTPQTTGVIFVMEKNKFFGL